MAGTAHNRMAMLVGIWQYTPGAGESESTQQLNAANTWIAQGFQAPNLDSKTINAIKFRVDGVTGVLGANDLRLDIYTTTGTISTGHPNVSQGNSTTVTTQATSGNTPIFVEFTGFSFTPTPGTFYWTVLRNLNGTPASNFPTIRSFQNINFGTMAQPKWATSTLVSTDGGTTWSSFQGADNLVSYRIQYSDGTYDGVPLLSESTSNFKAFAGNEPAVVFTLPGPPSLTYNVVGAYLGPYAGASAGNPTVGPTYRLFSGANTAPMNNGTTNTPPIGSVNNTAVDRLALYFPAVVPLKGGTQYRLSCFDNTDGSTTAYGLRTLRFENDAHSTPLLPMSSFMSVLSGGTWTDTTTDTTPFALLLDPGNEFL